MITIDEQHVDFATLSHEIARETLPDRDLIQHLELGHFILELVYQWFLPSLLLVELAASLLSGRIERIDSHDRPFTQPLSQAIRALSLPASDLNDRSPGRQQ